MTIDAGAHGTDQELWHVQLGRIVAMMTLDELDNAFQSGVIDERTMVLEAGALHWTTLGNIAGIDETPSLAPIATDVASARIEIPPHAVPKFDLALGTEQLPAFRPKRRIGKAFGILAATVALAAGLFAMKDQGPRLRERVVALVAKGDGGIVRAAAVAPVAEPPKAAAPPPEAVNLPPAKAASASIVSIDSLPSATPKAAAEKNVKKRGVETSTRKPTRAGVRPKSSKSSDPTTRGTDRFDPLNGNL